MIKVRTLINERIKYLNERRASDENKRKLDDFTSQTEYLTGWIQAGKSEELFLNELTAALGEELKALQYYADQETWLSKDGNWFMGDMDDPGDSGWNVDFGERAREVLGDD